ncbi:hypothetical protein ABEB36_003785 [Hypothenemus hampei]|uniref:Uncharacterized protein n=1 Tax=Hypothenemus hampei TaxID=57062 RepID=A0ABD1F196_HYPHA
MIMKSEISVGNNGVKKNELTLLRIGQVGKRKRRLIGSGVESRVASPVNIMLLAGRKGVATLWPTHSSSRGLVFPEFLILVVALRFCEAGYESIIGAGETDLFLNKRTVDLLLPSAKEDLFERNLKAEIELTILVGFIYWKASETQEVHKFSFSITSVDTVEVLQERIFQAIHEITPGMINNAIQHVRTHAEACLAANGGHFEQLL